MAYDLGTARGVIELTYNGKGVKQAQDDLAATEKKGLTTSEAMKKTSRATGIAGLAIAGGLGLAVKAAADFEKQMSGIAAVSGAGDKQMDQLRNKALQLGKDTQFSASEAAQGIEELVKAGVSVPDVLNGAADAVTALAAAGGIDLATSATIASNAMNAFNIDAKDMNGVVDSIAGAANASAIDVGQFGESLQQVGAVAHLTGVDFDDTATAIALMGNAGIKGSDAGTSLKTMFMRLNPSTKKAHEEMRMLGLITKDGTNRFYDAKGRMKDLSDVAGILQGSLKGMTKQQKQAALTTIFGSDAIRGAAVLADQGSKGFDKMSKSMGKVSAADVAAKRMDNLAGSFEQMKGSLETAGIALGTALLPPLRQAVDAVTSVINVFLGWSPAVQGTVAGTLAAVAAILLMISAMIKIVRFAQEVRAVMVVLRSSFIATWLAALGPIALVIAAIAAIIIILVILYKHSETARAIIDGAFHGIMAAAKFAWDWIKAHWPLLVSILGGPVGIAVVAIIKNFDKVMGAIHAVGAVAKWLWNNAFQPALHFIVMGISALLDMWGHMLSALGHVPGFGWAKDAGAALQNAADKARDMANAIHDIPDHKESTIVLNTVHNVVHTTGGHVPAAAEGGFFKRRQGGTLVQLAEGDSDEAVVPTKGGVGVAVAKLLEIMGATSGAAALATAGGPHYATPAVGSAPKPRRARRGGDSRMSRVIDGELRLHESGRAFIRGVAEDAIADSEDYDDSTRRMG
jgi:TP901 family phage tail tape measure protein